MCNLYMQPLVFVSLCWPTSEGIRPGEGFDAKENSWEAVENIFCVEKIEEFEKTLATKESGTETFALDPTEGLETPSVGEELLMSDSNKGNIDLGNVVSEKSQNE